MATVGWRLVLAACSLAVSPALATAAAAADTAIADRAWQVLEKNCLGCHGTANPAGLDLHFRDAILKGGKSGPAAIPGKAEESRMYRAAAHAGELKMPPGSRAPLPQADLDTLKQWINAGLPAPTQPAKAAHWAFQPVRPVTPPADSTGWSANDVDRFVVAKLRERSLKPGPPADRRTLVRRVYFDLVGLPPAPEELDRFIADRSPDAYPKLIDRLLASPRYGERWGRHWMDVVHYADTAGDNADYPVPEARLYRDYIINAFNHDKPYDQFVQEQLAGDILARQGTPGTYAEQVTATGYLALTRRYAGASFPYEMWHLVMEDAIETSGRAFLGLTLRCARCHDHKFDPITTRDYYGLYGIFASTKFAYAGSEMFGGAKTPGRMAFLPLLPPEQAAPRIQAYQEQLSGLQKQIKALEEDAVLKPVAALDAKITAMLARSKRNREEGLYLDANGLAPADQKTYQDTRAKHEAALREATAKNPEAGRGLERLRALRAEFDHLARPGVPAGLPVAYGVQEGEAANARIQFGGEPEREGALVPRNVPAVFTNGRGVAIPEHSSGRLEFARWLTDPENPLTARVMVNRIWQHHFGQGIVGTPSNFGTRGEPPTHPELLDWLAAQFVRQGWSIKSMHRLLMLSRTYQLAGAGGNPDAERADPSNRLYWRFNRQRLEAEAIRDSMLAVSGNLNLGLPDEHPFPPIEDWHYSQHVPFKAAYESNHRSVYLMTQRLVRHPYLALFDAPDTNVSTDVRTRSTVPLQALYLMNNPFVLRQAESLAERVSAGDRPVGERIRRAILLTWGREPSASETQRYEEYLSRYSEKVQQSGTARSAAERQAWASFAHVLLTANEFFYVD